ncbi:MAG: alanine racemase [candidate division WOR-3 bacterium]|nr:alanine racemase [candidate division WOR-3 bacterium]
MAKKKYEAPFIERRIAGLGGKFTASVPRYQDNIDGIPVKELIKEYGSPLFVFSEHQIRTKFREAVRIFSLHYPKVTFAWSYKTNYLLAICAIFHSEGAWAEVVSGMEYERARSLGVPGKRIIFNGPAKSKSELTIAVREDATINIDNTDELFLLEEIATEIKTKPKVGIRINMDSGIYPPWLRFGFNYENGEAYRTIQRIATTKKLQLIGLHTHIGTFVLEPRAYYQAASKLLRLAETIEEELGIKVSFIDLGGGFASSNTLYEEYLPGNISSPDISQYAKAISEAFNESRFVFKNQPNLILETGRALIDEAGYLITSVQANKVLPDGTRALIVDAGVNLLYTANWYKHNFIPAQPFFGALENTVIYGPLCMNIDILRPFIRFPNLNRGDMIIINPVGAYNVTQWMQFITYRPNVVLITSDKKVVLIRKKEDFEYLVAPEILPRHLRLEKKL